MFTFINHDNSYKFSKQSTMDINLKNGYFTITRSKNQFKSDFKSANNKVVNTTERMHNRADIISNILATIRGTGGAGAVVVDHTEDGVNMYYLQADGTVVNPDGSTAKLTENVQNTGEGTINGGDSQNT